jgi:hypothetical protein
MLTRWLLWLLRVAGLDAREAEFFAGHVSGPTGEPVYLSARRMASALALRAAREMVDGAPRLQALDRTFGRHTVRLHLARAIANEMEQMFWRIHAASAIAASRSDVVLLLASPRAFDQRVLLDSVELTIVFYRPGFRVIERLATTALALGRWLRPIATSWFVGRSQSFPVPGKIGVLLPQEDPLSVDRSYRHQPHWLSGDAEEPPFTTWILEQPSEQTPAGDRQALAGQGVNVLDSHTVSRISRTTRHQKSEEFVGSSIRVSLIGALFSSNPAERHAHAHLIRLFARARVLARVCSALNVRVFVSSNPHLLDVDAVQVVAEPFGIKTVMYQYSNLAFTSPRNMTTADIMATFSPRFHQTWRADGIEPRAFVDIGYVYDSAFDRVRARAAGWRQQLVAAGARFIVCYFDENVQTTKYGLTSPADNRADLHALAQWLVEDPTAGVIVKSQFGRNTPGQLHEGDDTLARARSTGRYLELTHGTHRNVIFPAEAALASDLAIGHLIGATAALEAALTGTPCVLLSPHAVRTANDDLYRRAAIIFRSVENVLDAVGRKRAMETGLRALGDWSASLAEFDPFRDGHAADRLRGVIEHLVRSGGASSARSSDAAVMVPAR